MDSDSLVGLQTQQGQDQLAVKEKYSPEVGHLEIDFSGGERKLSVPNLSN